MPKRRLRFPGWKDDPKPVDEDYEPDDNEPEPEPEREPYVEWREPGSDFDMDAAVLMRVMREGREAEEARARKIARRAE